jgi:hypothetical protein
MLNELYQVATALDHNKLQVVAVHPSLEPMRSSPLLVVRLSTGGQPASLEVLDPEIAETVHRVKHSSSGSSFPAVNLPLPLCDLADAAASETAECLSALVGLLARKDSSAQEISRAARGLYLLGRPAHFKPRQQRDFQKSVSELVAWLRDVFREEPEDVRNLKRLLDVVYAAQMKLETLTPLIADQIVSCLPDIGRAHCAMAVDLIFGTLDWKGRNAPLASEEYFQQKSMRDRGKDGGPRKQFIYLDLANEDLRHPRVSDRRLWDAVNRYFLAVRPAEFSSKARTRKARQGIDAFTGRTCALVNSFRGPKLIRLKSSLLFSNNTDEAECFFRYGLGKADTFKVGEDVFLKIGAALAFLAGHDKKRSEGRTWMVIPAPQPKKVCLLVAYLEEQPEEEDEFAALFGTHDLGVHAADYEARTANVLATLKGRIQNNPDLHIRLLAIAAMDDANNQIVLNRSLLARDVVKAAEDWNQGALNCPNVTMIFPTMKGASPATGKKSKTRERAAPAPLDICSVINKVWATKAGGGFESRYQRAVSVSDAYDIFLCTVPLNEQKSSAALGALLVRMVNVFTQAGRLKATGDYSLLDVNIRWQVLKAIALIGILLRQFNQHYEDIMKDSIYQVGRLLAISDSLHFHYCKWVRTSAEKRDRHEVDAPNELLGNALFSSALDDPKRALARLAERIKPYQGWAKSYSGEDDWKGRWLLRLMSECEQHLDLTSLPERMEDIHKAQLLLGYLADHPKTESTDREEKQ